MNLRIALSGKMASGKSVVAQHLVDKHGFIELAFATRLKEMCTEMFGFDVAKKDERGRLVLQQFAARMREIDPMVWVRYVINRIPLDCNVVVSDVRYPNEYDTLRGLGFTMVRMYMSRETQERLVSEKYPGVPLVMLDDYSERAVDNKHYDYKINNDGGITLQEVYAQTDSLIGSMLLMRGGNDRR